MQSNETQFPAVARREGMFVLNSLRQSVAAIAALWLAAAAPSNAGATNLLTNPGFEEGMTGWALTDVLRGGSPSVVITNPLVAHSGNNCVVSSNHNVGGWPSLAQGDDRSDWGTGVTVPVSDTNWYRLSAWVKLPPDMVGSQMTLYFKGSTTVAVAGQPARRRTSS